MKKILSIAVIILVAVAAKAQEIKIGFKGGVNIANITKSGNSDFSTDARVGFNAGLTLEVPIVSPLSFAPEVLYSQKGYEGHTTYGDYQQRINFIDVPLLAKVRVVKGVNVLVGPQVSFLISKKNSFETGFAAAALERYEDDADNFKKNLIAGIAGLSFDINPIFDLHARYAIDLQKANEDGTLETPQFKNQVWSIGFGFKF